MKKSEVNLVFLETFIDEKGSPHERKTYQLVPCDERKQFGARYYNEQERNMRESIKLSIASYYVRSELQQVEYNNVLYDIKNIMSDNSSSDRYVILDCQEVKK